MPLIPRMNRPLKYVLIGLAGAWAIAILVLFHRLSENGRYVFRSGDGMLVLDTRTGAVYRRNGVSQQLEVYAAAPARP